jgi:hypothetical protein
VFHRANEPRALRIIEEVELILRGNPWAVQRFPGDTVGDDWLDDVAPQPGPSFEATRRIRIRRIANHSLGNRVLTVQAKRYEAVVRRAAMADLMERWLHPMQAIGTFVVLADPTRLGVPR